MKIIFFRIVRRGLPQDTQLESPIIPVSSKNINVGWTRNFQDDLSINLSLFSIAIKIFHEVVIEFSINWDGYFRPPRSVNLMSVSSGCESSSKRKYSSIKSQCKHDMAVCFIESCDLKVYIISTNNYPLNLSVFKQFSPNTQLETHVPHPSCAKESSFTYLILYTFEISSKQLVKSERFS